MTENVYGQWQKETPLVVSKGIVTFLQKFNSNFNLT